MLDLKLFDRNQLFVPLNLDFRKFGIDFVVRAKDSIIILTWDLGNTVLWWITGIVVAGFFLLSRFRLVNFDR